jgi:hypothetical protein
MHHAARHLKSVVSLPDFACFVKALLAACLARETERMRHFKISYAPETSELATSRKVPDSVFVALQ